MNINIEDRRIYSVTSNEGVLFRCRNGENRFRNVRKPLEERGPREIEKLSESLELSDFVDVSSYKEAVSPDILENCRKMRQARGDMSPDVCKVLTNREVCNNLGLHYEESGFLINSPQAKAYSCQKSISQSPFPHGYQQPFLQSPAEKKFDFGQMKIFDNFQSPDLIPEKKHDFSKVYKHSMTSRPVSKQPFTFDMQPVKEEKENSNGSRSHSILMPEDVYSKQSPQQRSNTIFNQDQGYSTSSYCRMGSPLSSVGFSGLLSLQASPQPQRQTYCTWNDPRFKPITQLNPICPNLNFAALRKNPEDLDLEDDDSTLTSSRYELTSRSSIRPKFITDMC